MIDNCPTNRRTRRWSAGAGLVGGAVAAAMLGAVGAPAARADDLITDIGVAGATGNQFDPAVIPYSPDPSNLFAPVYTIAPVGPEEAISTVTDPNNMDTTDAFGTQDFSVSSLGFPVDSFTGNVEYTPTPFDAASGSAGILSQLSQEFGFGSGYSEEIFTSGGTGAVLPDQFTGFLIDEFGFGYGNVFEESMDAAGTSSTVGDFVLTPFGNENITPIIDFLMNSTGSAAAAPDAAADIAASATDAASTPGNVIGQAITDLNNGVAVLDAAPTADLSARQAETLATSINLNTELDSPLAQMATLQDGFSAADQTYLANADEQLVTAAANILSADQSFVVADQAGELSGNSFNATDLTLLESAVGFLNADLNVGGAELFALFTGGLDPSSAADLASSIDPVTAVDPSVFADLLSSIGL